jgi:uncharacterized membrane protein
VTGYTAWVERAALGVELLAALMIFVFVVTATLAWLFRSIAERAALVALYESYRQRLGRALLVGLEILVAADIIRTVVLDSTLQSVAGLGLLVLIRTFLSWSITLEIEGRWPWERPGGARRSENPDG